MPDDQPTLEEMQKKLKEMGIPTGGEWGETPGGPIQGPFLEKQVENLKRLEKLLETQIELDMKQVGELQEKVDRLRRGGGM